MTETFDIRIDVIPDRAGVAAVDASLIPIEERAKKIRESMSKATAIDPTGAQAGARAAQAALAEVQRSQAVTKQSADQLKASFAEIFARTTGSAQAVSAQTQLQTALGNTQKAAFLTDKEIDALMGPPPTAATTAVRGLGEEAVKTTARFTQLKAAEQGAFGTGSLGIDTSALQRYRAALLDVQRAREDAARVAGLSKGEAEQLNRIVGPTIARGRAQADLNSLLAQGSISAQQHARAMQQVELEYRQAGKAAGGLGTSIRGAFTVAAVALAVREAVQLADAYRAVQNRLATVTSGQAELARVTENLFDVSNQTRISFQATAEVYARTAAATKQLGLSQDSLTGFVKSLNQAVAVSGATGVEARNGLIQFSQGLAAGALRGDELRSVLEQLPAVADVIAKQFGVTRGQLKRLGEEGRLTTEQIIEAFRKAAPELESAFAKTVPTISGAFEVLRNNVLKTVGALDQTTGVSATVSRAILLLANNFDTAALSAGIFGVALLGLSKTTVPALIAGLVKLRVATLAALPVTGLVAASVALAAAIIYTKQLNEEIDEAVKNQNQEETLTLFSQQSEALKRLRAELVQVNKVYEQGGRTNQFAADRAAVLQARINALATAQRSATDAGKKEEQQRQRSQDAVQKTFRDLDRETALLRLNADEREVQARLFKELDEIRKAGGTVGPSLEKEIQDRIRNAQAAKKEADALEAARAPQVEAIKLLDEATIARDKGAISQLKYLGALREFDRTQADLAAKKDLSAGEAAIYDQVEGAIVKATQALEDAEGAAKKAGAAGSFYSGIIADLKKNLEQLVATQGLSSNQIAIRDEVLGSIEKLNQDIRDTQVLFLQAGANADLYGEKLAGLTQRREDLERARASGVGDTSLFLSLTQQAVDLDRELQKIAIALANIRDQSLAAPLVARQTDVRREQEDVSRNTGLNRGEIDTLNQVKGPQIEYARRVEDINSLLARRKITEDEAAAAMDQATIAALQNATSIEAGYTRAFAKLRQEARDTASVIEKALNVVVNRVVDAITTLLETGKFQFKSFAYELLKELARIFLRALIVQAVVAAIGGGGGAGYGLASAGYSASQNRLFSEESGPPQRAGGGGVEPSRGPYLVGERGPELFTPESKGQITPASQTAAAPQSPPVVNVTVANVTSKDEVARAISSGEADVAIVNAISRQKSSVRKIVA